MAAQTGIEWADGTLNLWVGCTKVSPACDHCYAETWANRFPRFRDSWGPHAERVQIKEGTRNDLDRWGRRPELLIGEERAAAGERPFVFVNSLSDFFDNAVPQAWRDDGWARFRRNPRIVILLLTKRPQNIAKMLPSDGSGIPPNVAIGTSVGLPDEVDRNVGALLDNDGALFYFVSAEPLLGHISGTLFKWIVDDDIRRHPHAAPRQRNRVSWVIAGGESGADARPMHYLWPMEIGDACHITGATFNFKQHGEWLSFPPGYAGIGTDPLTGGVTVAVDGKLYAERNVVAWDDGTVAARVGKDTAGVKLIGREWVDRPHVGTWAAPT